MAASNPLIHPKKFKKSYNTLKLGKITFFIPFVLNPRLNKIASTVLKSGFHKYRYRRYRYLLPVLGTGYPVHNTNLKNQSKSHFAPYTYVRAISENNEYQFSDFPPVFRIRISFYADSDAAVFWIHIH